jgi:hypothetical protein
MEMKERGTPLKKKTKSSVPQLAGVENFILFKASTKKTEN